MSTTVIKPSLSAPITKAEWLQIEQYYINLINQVRIPEDPKPHDITSLNSKLSEIYHEARLDYYYAVRAFDNIEGVYRKLKRALYPIAKTGKNQEERDHLLQDHLMLTTLDKLDPTVLKSLGLPAVNSNIYTIFDAYKERVDFIKTVLDMISDKTSRLITDSGAMKIEASIR